MWIAIRLPQLPLEIFLRGSSTPEPFALEERHRVFACDRKALMRGVRAGMAVAAALALAPRLRIAQRDPAAETEALLGVAGWAAQFTPGVALEFPDAVLLEAAGSLKLFGAWHRFSGACAGSWPRWAGARPSRALPRRARLFLMGMLSTSIL